MRKTSAKVDSISAAAVFPKLVRTVTQIKVAILSYDPQ